MKKIKIKEPKARVTWAFSPVTRVKPSKKIYSRKKAKKNFKMTEKQELYL